ncbi:hypothetical protein GGX14DRAFT_479462 [Mycena pura]|uniref:Uncharacterized protein n=1 Tax=Mycena pura TaxID=153505 RepID=A0AAD6UQY5_9AGAR|nr:hypothetical protein GGX14DRAFT_479462 [Mycena pura]
MPASRNSLVKPPISREISERTLLHPEPGIGREEKAVVSSGSEASLIWASIFILVSGKGLGWLALTPILSLLSLVLHVGLVALHALLVLLWQRGWAHGVLLPLEDQSMISLTITAISMIFATVYSAILVFLTQKLAARRNLRILQPLTAAHDTAAAWAGIGSAIWRIWQQRQVRSSVASVISTAVYLGAILALHTTTPALFTLVAFNSTQTIVIPTRGLPMFSDAVNASNLPNVSDAMSAGTPIFSNVLYLQSMETIGLQDSTLYDVLDPNNGASTAEVRANTFQMSCGYLPDATTQSFVWDTTTNLWNITIRGARYNLSPPRTGFTGFLQWDPLSFDGKSRTAAAAVFWSTLPILDSNGDMAPQVNLPYPASAAPNGAAESVQLFRCMRTMVPRTATVDAKSRRLVALSEVSDPSPTFWAPFGDNSAPTLDILSNGQMATPEGFLDAYAILNSRCYKSADGNVAYTPASLSNMSNFLLFPDLFLVLDLGLLGNDAPTSVSLDSFQRSLEQLLASMYWMLAHYQPSYGYITGDGIALGNLTTLVEGTTSSTQVLIQGRLNVVAGLAASTILLVVSFHFLNLLDLVKAKTGVRLDATDLLHSIWLYRRHPELEASLEQVDVPTNTNLRRAGMVEVRLVSRARR